MVGLFVVIFLLSGNMLGNEFWIEFFGFGDIVVLFNVSFVCWIVDGN